MTALEKVQELLREMSAAEKAQVLQWVARDLAGAFPGIESTSGVLGGDACIVRTRIPVWLLVHARQAGASEADILRSYPTLTAEDLTNAWAYYRAHRDDVEHRIRENEAAWPVARLYADENFPLPVTEALREHGHDVLTMQEDGKANQR